MFNLFLIFVMAFSNYSFTEFFHPVLKVENSYFQTVSFEEDSKRPTKSHFKFDPEDVKAWKKKAAKNKTEQQKKKGPPKEVVEMWKKRAEEMQAKPQKPKHKVPNYGPLHFDMPHRWNPWQFHHKKNYKKYRTFNLDYHGDKIV